MGVETEMKKILAGILMVIMMMTVVTVFAETAVETATDPILDLYPGLELGMSPDEVFAKYGEDQFEKYAFDTDTVEVQLENGETATAKVSDLYLHEVRDYHGKNLNVVFEFDDNQLIQFGVAFDDEDLVTEIMPQMEKVYGKIEIPEEIGILQLFDMMSGTGPMYGWETDTMKIDVFVKDKLHEIRYTPVRKN